MRKSLVIIVQGRVMLAGFENCDESCQKSEKQVGLAVSPQLLLKVSSGNNFTQGMKRAF